MHLLPPPNEINRIFPNDTVTSIHNFRTVAESILRREDERLAVVVGPCSVHDVGGALEYAERLKKLSDEVSDRYFLVMRVFVEKPRTRMGWKGLLYAPDPGKKPDLEKGIETSRQLMRMIAEIGVPIATEFVNPLTAKYLGDFVTWGFVGARTSYSQPHRELVSSLPFPVGFKNCTDGDLVGAINGMYAAREPHTFLSLSGEGKIVSQTSSGNPNTHLVLRGSDTNPNHEVAVDLTCNTPLLIDCAHGNSAKCPEKQKEVFTSLTASPRPDMAGLMLESYLHGGNQQTPTCPYTSLTDPCLDWETTQNLLRIPALT